ncbi:excinuclease ABC subunit UvrC [Microbacteriaceae bacterium VKM Ac-2855]|nr:excinuclease ABC subunit UvrC [Microbacteriaceae bacterium VKM Ac-2855]
MSNTVDYRPKAGEIPTSPGVYRFRDEHRRVLYVGKAKNLRQRLSNYFQPLPSLHERTRRMVTSASSVEWTVVSTDVEALQLEFTWINEFDPPFNVKFRDDKSYPYMAVTLGDEAPRVMVTRNTRIRGARYFGPYPKIWAIHESIDLMVKAIPIRTCNDANYKRAMQSGKPCFASQIGRCGGPCSQKISFEDHRRMVDRFVAFMGSYDRRMIGEIEKAMRIAAADFDYEQAAKLRDQAAALDAVLAKSAVVLKDNVDVDLYAIVHDELAAAVQQFRVRGGRIRGERGWVVDKELDMSTPELVDMALQAAYEGGDIPPREIVVPELPDDTEALETWLGEIRGSKVALRAAQRGDKAALLETATQNAKQALMLYKTRRSADFTARTQALEDIRDALGMAEAPLRMECYDVSHLSGTNIVASMVVFEDGLVRKDQYRRFTIAESTDDTDSLYQVLTRRLAYLKDPEAEPVPDPSASAGDIVQAKRKKFAYPPNLLIVDGGQPQVSAAQRALVESGVTGITLCGIAKRLEEIWLPDSDFPVILPRNSDALFLFQRIRDEAHRFAITHQRQRRKRDLGSQLGEIPGLGPNRVKDLLKHFGSVTRLRAATLEEITEVKGIGPNLASAIHTHLQG